MRYLQGVPQGGKLRQALEELFGAVRESKESELLSALVPVDTTMQKGHRVINYVPDLEMDELCRLASYFGGLVQTESDPGNQARIRVLVYCHIFEADFPLTVCWNLLRTLNGQECSWIFSRRTKGGKVRLCQYPRERVKEMERLSQQTSMSLGKLLSGLWQNDLRNAFSHSQYFLGGNALTSSRSLSPVSRPRVGIRERSPSFTFVDIEDLYDRAVELLSGFIEQYKESVHVYKNGELHKIQKGWIRWDTKRAHWN